MTINAVNNGLNGATGTSSFVGSANPVLTGNNDLSGATVLRVPVSASPSLSVTGQMALDDTVSGYPGLLKYWDGTREMAVLSMASADFSATNNYVIAYNNASSKLNMVAQSGGASGSLLQYVIATSTALDSTTSVTSVPTSLTASITPTNAASNLKITFTGAVNCSLDSGSLDVRSCIFSIRRTTGTPASLSFCRVETLASGNVTAPTPTYDVANIVFNEVAGDTSVHTYVIQFRLGYANLSTANLLGSTFPALLMIEELA